MASDGFARKPPYRVPTPKLEGIIASWMLRPDLDSKNVPVQTSADYPLEHEEDIEKDLGQLSAAEPDITNSGFWHWEEDTLLRRLRESNMSWNDVSKQFPARSANACCERYEFLLAKDLPKAIRPGNRWTLEEESVIREGIKRGKSMKNIASRLPGRTENACQCHYSDMERYNARK
jgi:hypothetical protein